MVMLSPMTVEGVHYLYTTLPQEHRLSAAHHMRRARVALDEGMMHVAADRMMRARRRLAQAAWLETNSTLTTL